MRQPARSQSLWPRLKTTPRPDKGFARDLESIRRNEPTLSRKARRITHRMPIAAILIPAVFWACAVMIAIYVRRSRMDLLAVGGIILCAVSIVTNLSAVAGLAMSIGIHVTRSPL